MTTGRGTTVARVFSAASGAVLVAVLAGCSLGDTSGSDPAGSPASATAEGRQPTDQALGPDHNDPPAFHFKSGDLILGDFTYEEVAGNIFNPCEEISAEEFAAIGFETDGRVRLDESGEVNGCVLHELEGGISNYAISGGSGNRETTAEQRQILDREASSTLPNVYTYIDPGMEADVCGAAVDTKRGQLGVSVGQLEGVQSREIYCDRAIEVLDALYQLNLRGNNESI